MGYTIHGIFQARIPEWVAVPFSRGSSQHRDWTQLSSLAGEYFESESESYSIMSNSLQPHGLYNPWDSPGQNTRVGSYSLLQGIFSTQGLNPGLPHCRQMIYQLSHHGSLHWAFLTRASQVALVVENPPANAGDTRDMDFIPGSGRSPGEGSNNLLQYSYLENPMDRGVWWAMVHRVPKSQTWQK